MKLTFQKASKKPVRVDVTQLTNSLWDRVYSEENHDIQINGYTLPEGRITEEHLYPSTSEDAVGGVLPIPEERKVFYINTLEDVSKEKLHKAEINDWLIVGVKGEIYACANDIFEETYTIRDSLMDLALEDSGYPNL